MTYPSRATTHVWDPGNHLLRTTRVPARFTYMWARVVRSIIYLSRNPHRANGADLLPRISGVWGRLRKTINVCARRSVTFTTPRKLLYRGGDKARRSTAGGISDCTNILVVLGNWGTSLVITERGRALTGKDIGCGFGKSPLELEPHR